MEEREFEAGVYLRTAGEFETLEQHLIRCLEDECFRYVILRHRHTVLGRSYGDSVTGVAVVAYRSGTRQGEVVTQFDSGSELNAQIAFVDTCHCLVHERTCLIVIIAVELCAVPTLGEESGQTTANDRVVELVGEVS